MRSHFPGEQSEHAVFMHKQMMEWHVALFLFFRSELILLFLISLPDKLPAAGATDCIKDTGEGDAMKSHETVAVGRVVDVPWASYS